LWQKGKTPKLEMQILEGDPRFSVWCTLSLAQRFVVELAGSHWTTSLVLTRGFDG